MFNENQKWFDYFIDNLPIIIFGYKYKLGYIMPSLYSQDMSQSYKNLYPYLI